ncbi:hypothetical protein SEVIR_2G314533v4 [Setaria viridis]
MPTFCWVSCKRRRSISVRRWWRGRTCVDAELDRGRLVQEGGWSCRLPRKNSWWRGASWRGCTSLASRWVRRCCAWSTRRGHVPSLPEEIIKGGAGNGDWCSSKTTCTVRRCGSIDWPGGPTGTRRHRS